MRTHVLGFIACLRGDGVRVSVAESLDALAALVAVGIDRPEMREALATTLVKEERDRARFDQRFDEWFPLVPAPAHGRRGQAAGGADPAAGGVGRGGGAAAGRVGRTAPHEERADPSGTAEREQAGGRGSLAGPAAEAGRLRAQPGSGTYALAHRPIAEFTAHDVQEARALVQRLGSQRRARRARRTQRARHGILDVRRMMRVAISTGGVPLVPAYRQRRPRRHDLLALCDASGSVAAASDLLLGLIAPAADFFRRVHCFIYVDRLCAASIEHGHVAPAGRLDLYARSDFGRVLAELWRDHERLLTRQTIVVVLGDARNNRLPPRPLLLRAVRARVRRLYWVIPEAPVRWNTGDSVLRLYGPHCDAVLPGLTINDLLAAVRRLD